MSFFAAIPLSPWIGFGVSLAVCGLIVLTKGWHGAFTFDTEVGPQKFHEKATPRIGGAALLLGFWAAALFTPPPTRPWLPLGAAHHQRAISRAIRQGIQDVTAS